jgi:hypothetical protein
MGGTLEGEHSIMHIFPSQPFTFLATGVVLFFIGLFFIMPLALLALNVLSWKAESIVVLVFEFLLAIFAVRIEPQKHDIQLLLVFGYGAVMVAFLGSWREK